MLRRLCIWLFALCCAPAAHAAGYTFDYNSRCSQAYAAYLSMLPDEGDAWIRQEFAANPHNLMATYLADYGDFIRLFFNGDPAELTQRKSHQDERLDLIGRGSDDNPWKRLCKAGIYMHWAIIYGRYGENFKAATTFRKSYLLIKDNKERFPDLVQNDIFLGVEEAVAGTIPDEYKWLASILGMKGNVRRGEGRLAAFLEHSSVQAPFRREALIYDLYIRFYLLYRQADAWRAVSAAGFSDNALTSFVYANIALNYHKAAPAAAEMKGMMKEEAWSRFPVFEYELANAQYLSLDPECVGHFLRYVSRNKGQLYTKDALMKCALFCYLQGNRPKAAAMRRAITSRGNASTDADKQAQRFAAGDAWPDGSLLRARIEEDGGDYASALAHLRVIQPQSFKDGADRLEYLFRLARAYDGAGDAVHAIQYYQQAISEGAGRKEQFGARASLQLALLYEAAGRRDDALHAFNHCLEMKGHDFQSSIDQQAKAGINRMTQR